MILPPALLPCPFCGATPVPGKRGLGGQHLVHCPSCHADGPPARTPQDAAAKYNHRPYRDAVMASAAARLADDLDPLFNPKGITS